jgi:proline iminopeptidase
MSDTGASHPNQGIIEVEGAQLNYLIEGEGPTCLVIGSALYYPRTFSQELRNSLELIFIDARDFAPSNPGFDDTSVTLDTLAEDIETARTKLGLGKVIVIGHSIHGLLAAEYTRRYPQNVSHTVILNTPPVGITQMTPVSNAFWETEGSTERKEILKENLEKLSKIAPGLSPEELLVKTYVYSSPKYWYDPRYDCSWCWEGVVANMAFTAHLYNTLLSHYDLDQGPGKITGPVYYGLGRHDYVVPFTLMSESQKAKLPGITFETYEKSGHTPQLEEPELFNQRLLNWLKSQ